MHFSCSYSGLGSTGKLHSMGFLVCKFSFTNMGDFGPLIWIKSSLKLTYILIELGIRNLVIYVHFNLVIHFVASQGYTGIC